MNWFKPRFLLKHFYNLKFEQKYISNENRTYTNRNRILITFSLNAYFIYLSKLGKHTCIAGCLYNSLFYLWFFIFYVFSFCSSISLCPRIWLRFLITVCYCILFVQCKYNFIRDRCQITNS